MKLCTQTTFNAALTRRANELEQVRKDCVNIISFAIFHNGKHGNDKPLLQALELVPSFTKWVGDIIVTHPEMKPSRKNKHTSWTAEDAIQSALEHVMHKLIDYKEHREQQNERRKERAAEKARLAELEAARSVSTTGAAPKPSAGKKDAGATKAGPVTSPEHSFWLTIGDEDHQLTQGEAMALLDQLNKMRKIKDAKAPKVVNG